mmetsp:Transcript_8784/g.22621  ORF Transcript_8784/g.22621 Transcript_8784/m.22621 type:complete len:346 (+) Transcript_8784:579-1616(+)
MVLDLVRRVPVDEKAVAKDLGNDTLEELYNSGHHREIARQDKQQVLLRHVLRKAREVADVREHDCHLLPRHMKARGTLVAAHDVAHHSLRYKSREGLDAHRETAEGPLQLAHVPDARALALAQIGEFLVAVGEVEVAEATHELAQLPQRHGHEEAQSEAKADAENRHPEEDTETGCARLIHEVLRLGRDVHQGCVHPSSSVHSLLAEGASGEHRDEEPARAAVQLHRHGAHLHALHVFEARLGQRLRLARNEHAALDLILPVRDQLVLAELGGIPAMELLEQRLRCGAHDVVHGVGCHDQALVDTEVAVRRANQQALLVASSFRDVVHDEDARVLRADVEPIECL